MIPVRPVMLAVGGDSGTGKTTLTRGIYDIFGPGNIVNICLDDYHTLDREGRKRERVTALNPAANNFALMEEHVLALRNGETIVKPVYDHATGRFGSPETVEPRPIVIIRGLFPLYSERMRSAFDVKVWLDPDEELKYHWKVQRDVAQRGYVLEEVIRQIVERQDDIRTFIQPQRVYADRVVRFYPPGGYLRDRANGDRNSHLNVRVIQRMSLPRLDLTDILEVAEEHGRPALRAFREDYLGEPADIVEIDAHLSASKAAELEERIWDHMPSHRHLRPDEIGGYLDGAAPRHSDPLALTQLLIAYRILAARDNSVAAGTPGLRRAG